VKLLFAFLALLALSCRQAGAPRAAGEDATASTEPSLVELREAARETLDVNCGECHTRTMPTALPRALRIFDLTETEWSRRMSEDQLREAARRLREPMAPTRAETEARPIRASDQERARFELFVSKEIETRRAPAAPR
jgi:hypothetical protein